MHSATDLDTIGAGGYSPVDSINLRPFEEPCSP